MQTTSTTVVLFDPVFADPERLALAGFLAGYSGLTRDAYELDLRQFVGWCDDHQLDLFEVPQARTRGVRRDLEGSVDRGQKAYARSQASTATRRNGC